MWGESEEHWKIRRRCTHTEREAAVCSLLNHCVLFKAGLDAVRESTGFMQGSLIETQYQFGHQAMGSHKFAQFCLAILINCCIKLN